MPCRWQLELQRPGAGREGLPHENHLGFIGGEGDSGAVTGYHGGDLPTHGGLGKGHVHIKEYGPFCSSANAHKHGERRGGPQAVTSDLSF